MRVAESNIIYENPLPQLCSKQSFFPFLAELENGDLIAVTAIGQAFESVDSSSYISHSKDGGKSWSEPVRMFDFNGKEDMLTDYCKVSKLDDGSLVAMGYAYYRNNPDLPIGNPENGGTLDDFVFFSVSRSDRRQGSNKDDRTYG